mgnify:CR=1 FL=1
MRDNLIEQLRTAFPMEPIQSTDAFEEWGTTYPDAVPYEQAIEGKTWNTLDDDYIVRRSDALGFLGTRQLIAVLPVYLRSLVEKSYWSPAAGMLMLILAKPEPGAKTGLVAGRFDALVDALTDAQRAAIASVLRAFYETDPDGSLGLASLGALDGHWKIYLPFGQ